MGRITQLISGTSLRARYLLDRLRLSQEHAALVHDVRRGLAAQTGGSPAELREAALLRALRERLAAAIGQVSSCRSCARGYPRPNGRWEGGYCCGARAADLFNEDELAALRLAGTLPADLRPPSHPRDEAADSSPMCERPPSYEQDAGCVFRGPQGCALRAADRPNLCVRYLCPDLTRELQGRGDLAAIESLCEEIEAAYLRFITARHARLDDEQLLGRSGP